MYVLGSGLCGRGEWMIGLGLGFTNPVDVCLCLGASMKDGRTSEELRTLVGVKHITTVIKSVRMR